LLHSVVTTTRLLVVFSHIYLIFKKKHVKDDTLP
jgi:hypothetical protein